LYLYEFLEGRIHRLVRRGKTIVPTHEFPRKLSETGVFASPKDHTPAPGVVPYSVKAPLWSGGALKERLIALPNDTQIRIDGGGNIWPLSQSSGAWNFPDGTVLVKTFVLESEPGNPASRRRVETRLLHLQKLANTDEVRDQVWRGYSYLWN